MLRPINTGAETSALFEIKKGAAFSVRQDQQNDTQIFVILFWLYVNSWGRDKTQIIGLCRRETLRHDFYV